MTADGSASFSARGANDIDGTEKCIKLLAQDVPNWECKLVYPTGGEIAIKGHGRYFTVKDYQK